VIAFAVVLSGEIAQMEMYLSQQRKADKGKRVSRISVGLVIMAVVFGLAGSSARAEDKPEIPPMVTLPDGSKTQEGAKDEDGKWVLPDGTISYRVKKDGGLDWYSYSGFKRYHDVGGCQQCHGPAGKGSTYAPSLVDSLKNFTYADFLTIVATGRVREAVGTSFRMPAMGDNRNVMCYIDDIYAYLKGRSQGAINDLRPSARARDDKPEPAKVFEEECFK
jgi:methanol metabolism-related c-type cytochrome